MQRVRCLYVYSEYLVHQLTFHEIPSQGIYRHDKLNYTPVVLHVLLVYICKHHWKIWIKIQCISNDMPNQIYGEGPEAHWMKLKHVKPAEGNEQEMIVY